MSKYIFTNQHVDTPKIHIIINSYVDINEARINIITLHISHLPYA